MSTTQPTPQLIGNLVNNIDRNSFVGLEERDNLIHAFLTDCAYYLSTGYNIKTAVRTSDDEFFNLQLFNESDNYQLLITYFPKNTDYKINDCSNQSLNFNYEVYYKIESKEANANLIKEVAMVVNMLMCRNYNNSNLWTYEDKKFKKRYTTDTTKNYSNKLITEEPLFSTIQQTNFLFLRQEFEFSFSWAYDPTIIA